MHTFRIPLLLAALILAILLAGCGTRPLLGEVSLSETLLQPSGNGENVTITYAIGQPAAVSVFLQDDAGNRYDLRTDQPRQASSDPYSLRFDGTVENHDDPEVVRQLVPDGAYTLFVTARSENGQEQTAEQPLQIQTGDIQPPLIENLVVFPETISPNADGIDDIAEITYQLPVTATVDITITSPDGQTFPFITADEQEPQPQVVRWNGRTVDGILLQDGTYTYHLRAQDRFGNIIQRSGPITIVNAGQPEVTITYANIAPLAVMRGELITVTMQVRNTGDVPIRTYGPPSGYEYSTDDVFSSIEDGQYTSKSGGFWRIGVDWDANSGDAPKRYPFRWAITPRPPEEWRVPHEEDLLMPGEEATVVGRIRVDQRETRMGFYAGLIQDGVGFFQDRTGRAIVEVGF